MYKAIYKCRACLQRFCKQTFKTEEEAIASLRVPNGMYAIHYCKEAEGTPKWIGNADFIGICEVGEDEQEKLET